MQVACIRDPSWEAQCTSRGPQRFNPFLWIQLSKLLPKSCTFTRYCNPKLCTLSAHITRSAQAKPARNKSGMCCLAKLEASSPGGQNPIVAITTHSAIFALSYCLKPPLSDCKVGCKLNQKAGFLPRATGGGRWGRGGHWMAVKEPRHTSNSSLSKSYTGIIPSARLWRWTQFFISQECESWQICATQAFHFTTSGFSGSSQAQGFTSPEPSNTPPAERMARAGDPGKTFPTVCSRLLSPHASCHTLLLLWPKLNPRRPNSAKHSVRLAPC